MTSPLEQHPSSVDDGASNECPSDVCAALQYQAEHSATSGGGDASDVIWRSRAPATDVMSTSEWSRNLLEWSAADNLSEMCNDNAAACLYHIQHRHHRAVVYSGAAPCCLCQCHQYRCSCSSCDSCSGGGVRFPAVLPEVDNSPSDSAQIARLAESDYGLKADENMDEQSCTANVSPVFRHSLGDHLDASDPTRLHVSLSERLGDATRQVALHAASQSHSENSGLNLAQQPQRPTAATAPRRPSQLWWRSDQPNAALLKRSKTWGQYHFTARCGEAARVGGSLFESHSPRHSHGCCQYDLIDSNRAAVPIRHDNHSFNGGGSEDRSGIGGPLTPPIPETSDSRGCIDSGAEQRVDEVLAGSMQQQLLVNGTASSPGPSGTRRHVLSALDNMPRSGDMFLSRASGDCDSQTFADATTSSKFSQGNCILRHTSPFKPYTVVTAAQVNCRNTRPFSTNDYRRDDTPPCDTSLTRVASVKQESFKHRSKEAALMRLISPPAQSPDGVGFVRLGPCIPAFDDDSTTLYEGCRVLPSCASTKRRYVLWVFRHCCGTHIHTHALIYMPTHLRDNRDAITAIVEFMQVKYVKSAETDLQKLVAPHPLFGGMVTVGVLKVSTLQQDSAPHPSPQTLPGY